MVYSWCHSELPLITHMSQSIIIIMLVLLLTFRMSHAADEPSHVEEIQVLIDVSGSMKQNDPQNLRVDAVQLLINLLPDNAKVSLWLFSENTKLLIETDAVDADWRRKAVKATLTIHSRGIYTHIEEAIQTALKDGFTGAGGKNLILLTDGMVDISKDIMVSADSRERILSEWIPRLSQQQIKVQTIALSDQADKELLEKLAFDTGGWSEIATSADQLQRLFLKTSQKVAPKDTLPLNNNQFSIDASIQEFSVLVFKSAGGSATLLVTPDQQKIDKNSSLTGLSWLEATNYDLITVKQPKPGNWQIEAAIDPDNQVMILTDLKLQLADIPQRLADKQALMFKLHFTEKGALVTRADFLGLVHLNLSIDDKQAVNIPASSTEAGYFSLSVNDLSIGKHKLTILADSKTFKREISRDVEVVSSTIRVEKLIDAANRQVALKFQPDIAALDLTSIGIDAVISKPNHPPESHRVEQNNGEWLLKLDALAPGDSMLLNFHVTAKSLDGHTATPEILPITIDDSVFTIPQSPVSIEPPVVHADAKAEEEHHAAEQPVEVAHPETENQWGITIAILLVVNLLLGGLGFVAYKMLQNANAKKQQQLLERLG